MLEGWILTGSKEASSENITTEENHSNEHASYEIPPLANIFESPIILSLDSLLKKIA